MTLKIRILTTVLFSLFSLPLLAQAESATSENQTNRKASATQDVLVQAVASNNQQATSNKANQAKAGQKVKRKAKTGQVAEQEPNLQSYEQNARFSSVSGTCVFSRASYTYSCN